MDVRLRIGLFGGLRLTVAGREVSPFRRPKVASLFAYLAFYADRPHPREALIELLWPESEPEAGRNNLRVTLHLLRRHLSPSAPGAERLLLAQGDTVQLRADAVTTDVAEFEAALKALRSGRPGERRQRLASAAALYGGELLPGFGEPWVLMERHALAEAYQQTLRELIEVLETTRDFEAAKVYARRAVSADPLREEAHHDLMRLYAATSQPDAALRQYAELERLLRVELDETPSPATRALAEELQETARPLLAPRSAGVRISRRGSSAVTPPARLSDPSQARLPAQFTRFYGREEEIARLTELLRSPATRLVTLTGTGGSGKTRLAVAVAGRLAAEAGEPESAGPWFVPLAELTDAALIPDAIMGALGLARPGLGDPFAELVAVLQHRRVLLVLDNFEQIVEAGAPLLRRLLEQVPALTCLVTSRRRLELEGEIEFLVPPLPTPRVKGGAATTPGAAGPPSIGWQPSPELLAHCPSVQLFLDRAQAARPEFQLTAENAAVVARLCDRLEGLPLALELAAARVRVLAPQQILERLAGSAAGPAERFDLLVSGRRDVSSRHRSLRAAIEWSYRLLSPELQPFWVQFSIFRGGWTLEAAEAVAGVRSWELGVGENNGTSLPAPTPDSQLLTPTLGSLEQLQQSSLILAEAPPGAGEMRYRMPESLRAFAAEQLSPEEQAALAWRHARHFLALAEQAEPFLHSPEEGKWLDRLEQEQDNFRAALDCCLNTRTPEHLTLGLRLAAALARFWFTRGYIREGRDRLAAALALCRGTEEPDAVASRIGPLPAGIDPGLWARALDGAGNLAVAQSDFEAARDLYEQRLALFEQQEERQGVLDTLICLGVVATCEGTLAVARSYYERSLRLARQWGDRPCEAESLRGLGGIAELEGDYPRAGAFLEESVPLAREVGPRGCLAWGLHAWGFVTGQQGDLVTGRALLEESLALFQQTGHRYGLARTLERLAGLALAQRQIERAARIYGAAASLRDAIGSPLGPLGQEELDRDLAALREALGEPAFARVWAEGGALSLDQALRYATGAEAPPAP